jgi:hypothetical protein
VGDGRDGHTLSLPATSNSSTNTSYSDNPPPPPCPLAGGETALTFVVAVAELFALTESVALLVTDAVKACAPAVAAVALTVTVTAFATARSLRLQVTCPEAPPVQVASAELTVPEVKRL